MSDNVIQHSFAAGELSPSLLARTDLPKYKSGAATMRNFFVDQRSGASTRSGLAFCNQTKLTGNTRLIPFQFSAEIGYIVEFGDHYCRFFINGGAVLESTFAVSGITNANPAVATITGNNYSAGQWIFITGVIGMPQINNRYFIVTTAVGASVTLQTTQGVPVNSTGYGTYVSGGTAGRVYEITSPYNATDLPLLKFAQLANQMALTHQNYIPYVLTAYASNNWALQGIPFGTTIAFPTGVTAVPSAAGTANYSYVVTAVDVNGQESGPSFGAAAINAVNIQTTAGSITITWNAVVGAVTYNIYKAEIAIAAAVPAGSAYGFIQSCFDINNSTGTGSQSFIDSNIVPDFTLTPPLVATPPIPGTSGVASYLVTVSGTYTTDPSVTVAGPPSGVMATAQASLGVTVATINSHHTGGIGDVITRGNFDPAGYFLTFNNGVSIQIVTDHFITTDGAGNYGWNVDTWAIQNPGSISPAGNTTPGNPVVPVSCSSPNWLAGGFGVGFNWNLTWGVTSVISATSGTGYVSPPSVAFSPGGAVATAVLGPPTGTSGSTGRNPLNNGNPGCVTFFQQRLYFAGSIGAPTTFWASQPGLYTNFNISDPLIDSDAIQGTLVSTQFNTIKSMLPMPGGLLLLTAAGAWQLSSGAGGLASTAAVTPSNATATPQAYNGASDIPPIIINYDILYVQSKGSIVRDLAYNIYANIYTGSDVSVLSNHLFFGHLIREWAWAEEPFRVVWAVQDDGNLLSLTYVKDQEMLGWARHDTNGFFISTASVREGINDVAYFIVARALPNGIYQSVERMVPRYLTYNAEDAFCVDCGFTSTGGFIPPNATLYALSTSGPVTFQTNPGIFVPGHVGYIIRMNGGIAILTGYISAFQMTGTWVQSPSVTTAASVQVAAPLQWSLAFPATTFYGLDYLNGMTVSILADGQVVPQQVVTGGKVTLPFAATKVTVGLPFQAQLQTMYLDAGEPTIQGKRKIIPRVTIRARESRGIKMGRTFSTVIPVKQFNPTPSGSPITTVPPSPLISQDEYFVMDPLWETNGQMCLQVDDPLPASILGVIPEVVIGDTPSRTEQ